MTGRLAPITFASAAGCQHSSRTVRENARRCAHSDMIIAIPQPESFATTKRESSTTTDRKAWTSRQGEAVQEWGAMGTILCSLGESALPESREKASRFGLSKAKNKFCGCAS